MIILLSSQWSFFFSHNTPNGGLLSIYLDCLSTFIRRENQRHKKIYAFAKWK